MKKYILGFILSLSGLANAQYIGTAPPNAEFSIFYSKDSDKTYIRQTTVGASHSSGLGFQIGEYKFQSQLVSANGAVAQATYAILEDNYEFYGRFGVRQVSHSTNLLKAGDKLADTIINRSTGLSASDISDIRRDATAWAAESISSVGNVSGTSQYISADAELRLTMTDSLSIGLNAATDLVQSEKSIQNGITYVFVGADVDLQMSDRLSLVVVASETFFSDANNRTTFKGKVIYDVFPEYSIATYYRLKAQYDSMPGNGNYFSPDRLFENAVGISFRKPINGIVYNAFLDYGNQSVLFSGETTYKPIYTWQLGAQTQPGKRFGNTFGVFITGSNTSSINAINSGYRWVGINSWVKVPLK